MRKGISFVKKIKVIFDYTVLSLKLGLILGVLIALYLNSITIMEKIRTSHLWIIFFLPIVGVFFLRLYDKYQIHTDRLIDERVTTALSFKRLVITTTGTIFSHLVGASIGRENTANRMSEDVVEIIANQDKKNTWYINQLYYIAMAAALAGTFGVPLAAIVLYFERQHWKVKDKGLIYTACVTCLLIYICGVIFKVPYPKFQVPLFHLTTKTGLAIPIVVILSLSLGLLFRICLAKWSQVRVSLQISAAWWLVLNSFLVLILVVVLHNTSYLGVSSQMQTLAVAGQISFFAFFWKLLLTMFCLSSRFQGGMITPAIDISLAFGASLAYIYPSSASYLAGMMMVGVLTVLSKAPLTSIVMGITFFNISYLLPFAVVAYCVHFVNQQPSIFVPKKLSINE